jgi:hypothetical protein
VREVPCLGKGLLTDLVTGRVYPTAGSVGRYRAWLTGTFRTVSFPNVRLPHGRRGIAELHNRWPIYYQDRVSISTYRWENSHTPDSLLRVSIGVLAGGTPSHIPKDSIPWSAFDQLNEDLQQMRRGPLAVGTIADADSSFSLRIASENHGIAVSGSIVDARERSGK